VDDDKRDLGSVGDPAVGDPTEAPKMSAKSPVKGRYGPETCDPFTGRLNGGPICCSVDPSVDALKSPQPSRLSLVRRLSCIVSPRRVDFGNALSISSLVKDDKEDVDDPPREDGELVRAKLAPNVRMACSSSQSMLFKYFSVGSVSSMGARLVN
jgi:hypothetical protein